jgi:hypothetical protein
LRPVEATEHIAAELAEDSAQDHRPLEIVAWLPPGAAEADGQLLESAERRVEPAGDAALGRQTDQVVAEAALAEGEEVGGRGKRLRRSGLERDEERLGGPLEEQERVTGDNDFERAAGWQSAGPWLDVEWGA